MKPISIAMVLAFACGSFTAYAAQRSISQKDKAFSESETSIKIGDTITFVNDDNISHNIMSNSAGNTFNLGAQSPGSSTSFTFKSAGSVEISCAIHPRMKLKVTVNN